VPARKRPIFKKIIFFDMNFLTSKVNKVNFEELF